MKDLQLWKKDIAAQQQELYDRLRRTTDTIQAMEDGYRLLEQLQPRQKQRSKQHAASQEQRKTLQTQLKQTEQRLAELDRLIPSTYEDKALGRIPESLCIQLMNQYETERQNKLALRAELS